MNMAGKLSREGKPIAVRHVAEVLAGMRITSRADLREAAILGELPPTAPVGPPCIPEEPMDPREFKQYYHAYLHGRLSRRDFLRELVGEVLDRGATVVFSTHILSDLERVAFNIAFLSQGRIALQAPLDELLDQVRAFTGSVTELASLMTRLGVQPLKRTPLEAGRERVLARLPGNTPLPASVAVDRLNLDDLFTELT